MRVMSVEKFQDSDADYRNCADRRGTAGRQTAAGQERVR
jgi:hypothetical protein